MRAYLKVQVGVRRKVGWLLLLLLLLRCYIRVHELIRMVVRWLRSLDRRAAVA